MFTSGQQQGKPRDRIRLTRRPGAASISYKKIRFQGAGQRRFWLVPGDTSLGRLRSNWLLGFTPHSYLNSLMTKIFTFTNTSTFLSLAAPVRIVTQEQIIQLNATLIARQKVQLPLTSWKPCLRASVTSSPWGLTQSFSCHCCKHSATGLLWPEYDLG